MQLIAPCLLPPPLCHHHAGSAPHSAVADLVLVSRHSRTMKSVLFTLLLLVVIRCAVAAEPAFDCVIASDRATYTVDEVPNITFRITNKSAKSVVLVGSLDGSTDGRRSPNCLFEILDAAGKLVTLPVFGCGNMNILKATDFVTVAAGDTFNPFGKGFFPPVQFYRFPVTQPGDYTFRFSYSTSDRVEDYFGDERMSGQKIAAPEIQRLFERVPKLDLKSNELKLKFTPKLK